MFNNTDVMIAPTGAGSFPAEEGWNEVSLGAQGYLLFGPRAIRADLAERLAWEIDKRRKDAGKNLFEIPAELASVVSCPGEAFVEVLKAYGLAPAEHDAETGAVKTWRFKARANPDGRPDRRPRKPQGESGRPPRGKSDFNKGGKRPSRNDGGKPHPAKARAAERAEARKNDPDNPFAALATLLPSEPPPKPKKKKKRKSDKPKSDAAAPAVEDAVNAEAETPEVIASPADTPAPETTAAQDGSGTGTPASDEPTSDDKAQG